MSFNLNIKTFLVHLNTCPGEINPTKLTVNILGIIKNISVSFLPCKLSHEKSQKPTRFPHINPIENNTRCVDIEDGGKRYYCWNKSPSLSKNYKRFRAKRNSVASLAGGVTPVARNHVLRVQNHS